MSDRLKKLTDEELTALYLFSDMLPADEIDAVETEFRKRKLSLRLGQVASDEDARAYLRFTDR